MRSVIPRDEREAVRAFVRYSSWTMTRRPLLALGALALVACNQPAADPKPSSPATGPYTPPASSAPPPAATATAKLLGAPITAPEVLLADVAKDPASFTGKPFTTRGTVTAVCQEMGCWMEIKDASTGAHLRMHGHSFFVPKNASGQTARVQATLVPAGAPKACADEAECSPKNVALLQLDATGVELD